jgi:transposase
MGLQSLLYQAYGLRDCEYLKTEYKGGDIIFHIQTKPEKLICPECKSSSVIKKGRIERQFKTLGIGMKPVFIHAHLHRVKCKDCGSLRQEHIHFADPKKVILIP